MLTYNNFFISSKILPKEIHKIKEIQNNVYSTFITIKVKATLSKEIKYIDMCKYVVNMAEKNDSI